MNSYTANISSVKCALEMDFNYFRMNSFQNFINIFFYVNAPNVYIYLSANAHNNIDFRQTLIVQKQKI